MPFGREPPKIKLWQLILIGPFLIVMAIWTYLDLATFEEEGGTRYLWRFTAFLYDIGGKSFVLLFYLGCGAFYIWALLRYLRNERESAQKLTELDEREASSNPDGVRPLRKRPLASPPRIDADPFRSPPHKPIVVERPTLAPVASPVVTGDSNDKPKLLT